jgi:hypothetical protein
MDEKLNIVATFGKRHAIAREGGVYRVCEQVTPQGHYITWPMAYSEIANAVKAIRNEHTTETRSV